MLVWSPLHDDLMYLQEKHKQHTAVVIKVALPQRRLVIIYEILFNTIVRGSSTMVNGDRTYNCCRERSPGIFQGQSVNIKLEKEQNGHTLRGFVVTLCTHPQCCTSSWRLLQLLIRGKASSERYGQVLRMSIPPGLCPTNGWWQASVLFIHKKVFH